MKNLIKKLILSASVVLLPFMLAAYNASLTVQSFNGNPIFVKINQQGGCNAAEQKHFEQINPGNHFVQIFELRPTYYGNPLRRLVFSGNLHLRPSHHTIATVHGLHNLQIEQRPLNHFQNPIGQCGTNNTYYNPLPTYGHIDCSFAACGMVPSFGYMGCGFDACSQQIFPMNDQQFNRLLFAIDQAAFKSNRISIAKQAIDQNFFTSDQIRFLVEALTFESAKVKIAKYAYAKTLDTENYFVVNDAFTFNSSIRELTNFIAYNS